MTDAKRYLQQIRILDIRIDTKLNELEHLKEMVMKVTPTLSGMTISGTGNQDKLGDTVSRIVDLENEIDEDIDKFVDKKREVSSILDGISNADQLQVLHKRYVQYKKWEQISEELGMTVRNVTYIHGSALKSVEDLILNKKERKTNGD